MDLSLTRDTARISRPVFESAADHPIDCDVVLPDYCPDIARILKTQASAVVDEKALDAGRMSVSGRLCVTIIYLPENSSAIRSVRHDEPFTHNFDVDAEEPAAYLRANAKVGYCNCRPVGPRRVQIRASANVGAKAWSSREENFITGEEEGKVETLKKAVRACTLVGAADKDFKLSDELEVGYGKPEIASVVKADAAAVMQDYKAIGNKVVAKGEVLLHTVYACDAQGEDGSGTGSRLEAIDHTMPISQIIDLEGVDEDCICEVRLGASDVKVEGVSDADGENRVLAVEMNLTADVRAYKMQEFSLVTDAFSTQYEMGMQTRPVSIEQLVDQPRANETIRETIDPGQPLTGVTDCTAVADVQQAEVTGRALVITGNLNVSLLASDAEGGPVGIEKAVPFRLQQELKNTADNMRCDAQVTVISAGCSVSGDKADLRVECLVEGIVFGVSAVTAVSDMTVDDSREKECRASKALTLYFADKGERVWDIAKKYGTSVDAIARENGMESDTLDARSMLLIPKKRCRKAEQA